MLNAAGGYPITVTRADANIPQTTTENIFTISGGMVKIISIVGTVGTAIQNQANNTKLGYDAGGGAQDICANLDIDNDAQYTQYSITGTATDAMMDVQTGVVNEIAAPLLLGAGSVALTCAASNTGTVSWKITYIPIEAGAKIVTA